MNPKSMLRRTLAMLLVLIFALSNMGLAEMADAIADGIPAVEEIAEDAAPVEEQAEEAAPAEEEPAPAEAPAEDEASDEAEAPAEAAPVVTVEAYQIDETSLFANAAAENFDGELAYQWEIAGEDGEWTAIDGATDSVYATEADDRIAQSYRCVVTAGDVAATSEATSFDPDAYDYDIATVAAEEPVMFEDSIEIAPINNGTITVGDAGGVTTAVEGQKIKLAVTQSNGGEYTWSAGDDAADVDFYSDDSDTPLAAQRDKYEVYIVARWNDSNKAETYTGHKITISCTKTGTSAGTDETEITILKKLKNTDLPDATVTLSGGEIGGADTAFVQEKTVNAAFDAGDADTSAYTVKFGIASTSDSEAEEDAQLETPGNWFTGYSAPTTSGTFTLANHDESNANVNEDTQAFQVYAVLENTDVKVYSDVAYIYPKLSSIAVNSDRTTIVAGESVEFTATPSPAASWTGDLNWSVTKSDADAVTKDDVAEYNSLATAHATKQTLTFKNKGTYTVKYGKEGGTQSEGTTITVLDNTIPADLVLTVKLSSENGLTAKNEALQAASGKTSGATKVAVALDGSSKTQPEFDLSTFEDAVVWTVAKGGKPVSAYESEFIADPSLSGLEGVITVNAAGGTALSNDNNKYEISASLGTKNAAPVTLTILPAGTTMTQTIMDGTTPVDKQQPTEPYATQIGHAFDVSAAIADVSGVKAWFDEYDLDVHFDTTGTSYASSADPGDYKFENGKLTFLVGGKKYKVFAKASNGYSSEPETANVENVPNASTGAIYFEVTELPRELKIKTGASAAGGDAAAKKEAKLVGKGTTGEADQLVIAVDTSDTKLTGAKYTWALTDNMWGDPANKPYLNIIAYKDTTGDKTDGPYTVAQVNDAEATQITVQVANGVTQASKKPVTISVSTTGYDEDTQKQQTVSATCEISVFPAAVNLTDADIDFPDEVPVPRDADKSYKPSATDATDQLWNTYTKLKLAEGKEYPVTAWTVVSKKGTYTEAGTSGSIPDNLLTLTQATGELTIKHWKDATQPVFTETDKNGITVIFQAQVNVGGGESRYLYKTVTFKPEPASVQLQYQTSTASSATPVEIVDGTTMHIRKGDTIPTIVSIALVGPTVGEGQDAVTIKPFGSTSNATWTVERRTEKGTNDPDVYPENDVYEVPDSPKPTTAGQLTIPVTSVDMYHVTVKPEIGDEVDAYFSIEEPITSTSLLIGGDSNRDYVNKGVDAKFELKLNTADANATDIYTERINWTIAKELLESEDVNFYAADPETGLKTERALDKTDEDFLKGRTAFYMNVGAGFNPTSAATNTTYRIQADDYRRGTTGDTKSPGTSSSKNVHVYEAIGDDPFAVAGAENALTLNREATGQNSTLTATLNAKVKQTLSAKNMKFQYVLDTANLPKVGNAPMTPQEAEKWVKVDPSSGVITIYPQESGDNPANKIPYAGANGANTYVEFTVKAQILGYENEPGGWTTDHAVEFTVYREATDLVVKSYDADGANPTDLPAAVSVKNTLNVKAEARSITTNANGVKEDCPSAAGIRLNASGARISTSALADAPGVTQITTNGTGTITITVTSEGKSSNNVSDVYYVQVIDETSQITASDGSPCIAEDGKHTWVLAPASEQNNPEGHIYTCACGATSNPVPHKKNFKIDDEGVADKKKADSAYDVLNYANRGDGLIACEYCGYACDHRFYTDKTKTVATRVDNTDYHVGTCPTCGLQIKQTHVDTDDDKVCDVCGATAAVPAFKDASGNEITELSVAVGKTVVPTLVVPGTKTWSVKFSTSAADAEYIQVVDAATGEIKGVKVIPATAAKKTATLKAEIVAYTTVQGSSTPKTENITKTIEVKVTDDPTVVSVEAEKDYVIGDESENLTNGKALVKLTAKADNDNPNWANFKWVVSATEPKKDAEGKEIEDPVTNLDNYFEFYQKAPTGGTSFETISGDATAPEVWIGVKSSLTESSPKGRLLVSYEYTGTEKEITYEPKQIDALAALDTNSPTTLPTTDLQPIGSKTLDVTLDKTVVAQGDTITVDESKFDTRYGTIEYSIEVDANSATDAFSTNASKTLLSKWATVNGKTVSVLASKTENKLADSGEKKMYLTAGIYKTEANGTKSAIVKKYLPFKIVPKLADGTVKVLYKTTEPTAVWADINTAEKLSFQVGDSIYLTTKVYNKDGSEAAGNIDWTSIDWAWPAESIAKHENVSDETLESSDTATGTYKLTFNEGAGGQKIQIIAGNPIKDVTVTIPVTPLIKSIELKAESTVFVPGETVTVDGETKTKELVIDYTITPAGATDSLDWYFEDVTGTNLITNGTVDIYDDTEKHQLTITPSNKGEKIIAALTAEAATPFVDPTTNKSTKAKSNKIDLTIYKQADASALLLEFEPDRTSMSVGETLTISKHEYDQANGYYSTIPLEGVVVTHETAAQGTTLAEGEHVLSVDPATFVVTAEHPGTATIELHAYNYEENSACMASKTITVEAAATELDFGAAIPDPAEFEMTVGMPPYVNIQKTAITAYRSVPASDPAAAPSREPVHSALVTLVSENPEIVRVDETATDWELVPVSGGTATVNAVVGTISKSMTVTVKDAINDIKFYVDGEEITGTQHQLKVSDTPVIVTWKALPENADPSYTISVSSTSADAQVGTDKVTVTPKAAGTITINAQTKNKDYVSGDDAANNQQYLKRHLDLVVTEDDVVKPVPGTGEYNIEIIGKKAVGPSESTDVVLLGVAEADAARVTWEITSGSATVEGTGKQAKVIGGETAGLATVAAKLDNAVLDTKEINVLTKIEKITFNGTNSYALNKDESVKLEPEITGYKNMAGPDAAQPDTTGIITYTMNAADTAYVRVDYDAVGNAYVVGVKQNTKNKTTKAKPYPITAKAYNSVTETINVTMKSNKVNTGFSIPQNGATLKMVEGDTLTVVPTWTPANTPAVLNWAIKPTDDGLELGGTDEAMTIKVTEGASESYTVTVTEVGYPDRPAQSFTIDVVEKAGSDAVIAYTKVGVAGAPTAASEITLVKGERIQAVLMNGEEIVAGTGWVSSKEKTVSVDAATGVITALKTSSKAVTITAPNGKTLAVKVKAAPKKFTFAAPAVVGVGEKFDITYECSTYNGTGVCLTEVQVSNDEMGFEKDEAGKYSFDEPGTVILTGNTTFGATPKTVTMRVLPAPTVDELVISGSAKIAKGQTVRLNVALNDDEADEEGYANIAWAVDGKAVTSTTKAVKSGVSGITAKLISNTEIEVTASSKAKEGAIQVTAEAAGYEMKAETFTLTAANADATLATGLLVFEKPVIAVGETTYAKIVSEDGEELGGNVKLSVSSADKKILTVSGNKVTAKKPGTVTVTAKAGSETKTAQIYIASAPDVVMNNKPAKIAVGSTANVALTIKGYATTGIPLDEGITASTDHILTATSSNAGLIKASIVPDEDVELAEDGVIRDYKLVLEAADKVETTKNKYPAATVTVNLFGKKFQSMKIQVVSETNVAELRFPKEIWIEPGKSMALTPSTGDATEAGVIDWKFVEGKQAAGMSFTKDGKLTVAAKTPVGGVSELFGTCADKEFTLTAHIGQKVKSKSNFSIDPPKTQIGVGEKMLMGVKFNGTYGGVVTWTSSKPAIASIDKVTGLLVGKQDSAGKTVTIKAKVGSATQTTKITVGGAPTKVEFEPNEYTVTKPSEEISVKVKLTGGIVAADASKESAYTIVPDDNTAGLIDEAASDLSIGKVVISSTAAEGSKATLRVTTYNGLTATCMIVYGVTEGGSTGPVTPSTQKLDSAELWVGEYKLATELTNPLKMVEGDTITPTVVAKDDVGLEIPTDAYTVAWSVDEASSKNVEIADNGTLTAKLFTSTGTTDAPVTVVATITMGDVVKSAEYHVSISPKFSEDHMVFEVKDNRTSLVEAESTTATFKFDNTIYDAYLSNVTVESATPDNLAITNGTTAGSEISYTLTAKNAGTAKIVITHTDSTGMKTTKTVEITIVGKPTDAQLSFLPASIKDGVTLVAGERMEFSSVLDEAFQGTPVADDFEFSVVDADGAPLTNVIVNRKLLPDSNSDFEVGKFILKADQPGEAYVKITAYREAEQTFKVTVLKAPTVTVDATPKQNTTQTESTGFSAGQGETVTLTVTQKSTDKTSKDCAAAYSQGLDWKVVSPAPSTTDPSSDPVLTPSEDGSSATLKYTGNGTVTVGLKCKDADDQDQFIKEVTVNFMAVPTAATDTAVQSVVTALSKQSLVANDSENVYVIGAGETVEINAGFVGSVYTNDIVWKTTSGKVTLDYSEDFMKCKVTGVGESSGSITVAAYYKDVKLCSVKIVVKPAPTSIELVQQEAGDEDPKDNFDFLAENGKRVFVKFNSASAWADCTLTSANENIVGAVQVDEHEWELSAPGIAGRTTTLTLRSSNGLIKTYIVEIKNS